MSETYTINMLKTYEECPQMYKFSYVDKIRFQEPNKKADSGVRLHALIKHHLNGADVSKLVLQLDKHEKILWHNFLNSPILKYKYIDSEYSFDVNLGGNRLTGRIDALFETDGCYIIADWKTGELTDENERFQTMFYLCCLYEIYKQKKLPVSCSSFALHYVLLKNNTVVKIKFTDELYMQYRNKILGIIMKIEENKNYFCFKTDKCRTCRFFKLCPYI